MLDGYKAAFKGAMQAYGILAINAVRWIRHVTGTGGDSEPHYWPKQCDICIEIAEFIDGWEYTEIDPRRNDVPPHPADGMTHTEGTKD